MPVDQPKMLSRVILFRMNMLRALLILLLTIAIPLEGLAGIRMDAMMRTTATPMEVAAPMQVDEACVMSMGDTGLSSKSTAPCKMGDACKICQVFPSMTSPITTNLLTLPLIDTVSLLPESFLPSHDPAGLWRPPRSL